MAGPLEEIFLVRTNGNGYFQQVWDHTLFQREIKALLAEGRIQEVDCPTRENGKYAVDWDVRRFRDLHTGDTYEYHGAGDRTEPRFRRVAPDNAQSSAGPQNST
jgi:hypothetical protein